MLRDRVFNDLNRLLPVKQAAAVQGGSRRRGQQALVLFSNGLSQMLENGLPSVIDHRLGRYRQAPAAPGLVCNAGGGLVAEPNFSKIFVVYYAGHNSTITGHGSFVAPL